MFAENFALRWIRSFWLWLSLLLLLSPSTAWAAGGGDFEAALAKGPLAAAAVALLGGFLVSLTPCVYPMVAITVSVFGARQSTSRWQGLALSGAFVAGIVAMFTPLGVVAGMTGSLFGSVLQNTWVLVGIAVLFLMMAVSMLGAFEMALPSSLTNRLAEIGGVGYRGAFGLGLVCGLIAAPCTGPVLTGILTYIAESQSATTGGWAMMAFSMGLGFPFLLVGAFAVQLPKSGPWMVHVKSLLAIVLSVVALYYLNTAFPLMSRWVEVNTLTWLVAGAAVLIGIALGAVHRDFHNPSTTERSLKGAGVALTTAGAFVLMVSLLKPSAELNWRYQSFEEASLAARQAQQPMLVDFTASWCGACKELDKETFADPAVNLEAGRFYAVKVDATNDEDPVVARTMEQLEVVGLPTVLLFDSSGREVRRFTDFVAARPFLEALEAVD